MSWIDEFTRPVTPHYSAAALNTAVSGAGLSPSTNLFADRRTISRPADFNPPGWTPASFYTENNITPPQFAISDLAQYTSGASPAPITPPPGAGPSVTAPPLVSPTGHPVLFANNQAPVPSPAPSTGGMTPDIGFIPRTAPQATPNGGFQISPRGGSPVPQQNNFQNRLMQSLMFLSSPGLSGGFGGFGGGFGGGFSGGFGPQSVRSFPGSFGMGAQGLWGLGNPFGGFGMPRRFARFGGPWFGF